MNIRLHALKLLPAEWMNLHIIKPASICCTSGEKLRIFDCIDYIIWILVSWLMPAYAPIFSGFREDGWKIHRRYDANT